jgi:hypothetical protein
MKEYIVKDNGLRFYAINSPDPMANAPEVGLLLQQHSFIWPDPKIKKGRFQHPAIINALAKIFFMKTNYGYERNSKGAVIGEKIPAAALAWVCVLVCLVASSTNSLD